MQNIYKHILVAVLAVLTLAACENEEVEPMTVSDYPTFSATIEGSASRAYDSSWEPRDKIGIGISGSETFENISYMTVNGDGKFTADVPEKKFIFQDDNPVSFIAYYPYGNLAKPGTTNEGKITTYASKNLVQKLADQKSFDYLWAEETKGSKANPDVKFTFAHQMSKITLVFKSGDGVNISAITSYSIAGLYIRGTFDPLSGKCETTTETRTSASLTLNAYDSSNKTLKVKENEEAPPIIVFPQTLDSNTLVLSVTAASAGIGTITGNLIFNDNKLEPGNNYRFVIKVSKTRLSMEKAIILPWKEEVLGEKEAS